MNGLSEMFAADASPGSGHRVPRLRLGEPGHGRLVLYAGLIALGLAVSCTVLHAQDLTVRLVGNAGVLLTDGETSLLIDLPYEPGAFGYMQYDPAQLAPAGTAVAVITHNHADHFDASLFASRPSWRIIGPASVIAEVPFDRVLYGDSIEVGDFGVVVVPSPHTDDHRSYRIRWRGRVLHFSGDTDQISTVPAEPYIDVLFTTPWLQCGLTRARRTVTWGRTVLYHRQVDGSDDICGAAELLDQGAQFTIDSGAVLRDVD